MRLEMPGWSIDVPLGWTAVVAGDRTSVRLVLDAEVLHDDRRATVTATEVELSIHELHPPGSQTTSDYADGIMRRHVPHGAPDVSSCQLGGREARVFTWTDGVQNLETYFVELASSTSLAVLRLDIAAPGVATETSTRGREAAARMLETMAL